MYYGFWYGFLFFPVLLQNFRQCQSSGRHCQLWTRVGKLHETRCRGAVVVGVPVAFSQKRMMTAFQTLCRIISHPCSTINQNWCGKTRPTERFISVFSSNSQASAIKHEWSLPLTSLGYSFIWNWLPLSLNFSLGLSNEPQTSYPIIDPFIIHLPFAITVAPPTVPCVDLWGAWKCLAGSVESSWNIRILAANGDDHPWPTEMFQLYSVHVMSCRCVKSRFIPVQGENTLYRFI